MYKVANNVTVANCGAIVNCDRDDIDDSGHYE